MKEEETTPAAAEASSEQPRGLGNLPSKLLLFACSLNEILIAFAGLLNRRKIVSRRPGTLN